MAMKVFAIAAPIFVQAIQAVALDETERSASLVQTEPLSQAQVKDDDKAKGKKELQKMSSTQCQTMCQRFGMPQLKAYDESFGKISHPTECVAKCKELTPSVFGEDKKSASFLQLKPDKAGQVKTQTKMQCKTLCQRFATEELAKTDPAFKGMDTNGCVAQCDKSEKFTV
eukprot:TRINITY_DN114776_c0_g1_i1.p1 TRINITY_DN114776_c0_g1~~TRINITY_DN114776_c0_g1_i1.p1  ORF type:complete len:170 (-),score=61.44 TRINITY_DN114776_c0_g1_i1:113-622(-)